jgi:3-deoxy-D-manno-octulosonic acid (KDO) 8-phosphate synthase
MSAVWLQARKQGSNAVLFTVWGLLQGAKRDKRMMEILLGAALAGNALMMIAFWVMMKEMRRDLIAMTQKVDSGLDDIVVDIPSLDTIKEEIFDVMGSMQQPSWLDHLGGALGQAILMKSQRAMQQAVPSLEGMVHNDTPPSP